ncbi:MAG: RnfABCDGE type electron transport complex subunit B [Parasporobacterium sp.]|nr:RnfABCDGE type electron transport complex subunit B [Parasporobacterium sp.]
MDINGILIAAAIVAGLGLVIGILLGVVAKAFEVPEDPNEAAVRECLPGNNCGGCGYAGCDALAAAIAKGEAKASACPVGGAEAAKAIAEIMGTEVDVVRYTAFVRCQGTNDKAGHKYQYVGNKSCIEAAALSGGGSKLCAYGCLGYGSCVDVCDFGALSIVNGVAYVNKEQCKACGMCVKTCPRKIIEIIPYDSSFKVRCVSQDKGKVVRACCEAGCIGCGLCAKNCEAGAITVENNIAHIDQSKCTGCGKCAEKCPAKCIVAG